MDDQEINPSRALDDVENTLRAHADRTEQHLRELEADLAAMQEDSATIQEDLNGTRRSIEGVRSDLARTSKALERIDAGTYGQCTSCGSEISAPRLAAIPEAELCTNCA